MVQKLTPFAMLTIAVLCAVCISAAVYLYDSRNVDGNAGPGRQGRILPREDAVFYFGIVVRWWKPKAELSIYNTTDAKEFLRRYESCYCVIQHAAESEIPFLFYAAYGPQDESLIVKCKWLETDDDVESIVFSTGRNGIPASEQWPVRLPPGERSAEVIPMKRAEVTVPEKLQHLLLSPREGQDRIVVKLVDAAGNSSEWLQVLYHPPGDIKVREYALRTGLEQPYIKGDKTTIGVSWLLDVSPAAVPDEEQAWNLLAGYIQIWAYERTIQWLAGKEVPQCYNFSPRRDELPEDMIEAVLSGQVEPGIFRVLKENRENGERWFNDEFTLFRTMPASDEQTWAEYLQMLQEDLRTKPYFDAIKAAEGHSPSFLDVLTYEPQCP